MRRPRITQLRRELAQAVRVIEMREAKIAELEARLVAQEGRLNVLRAAVRAEPELARAGAA